MSKVFLVRLHVIQFTRYSVKFLQAFARSDLYMLSQLISFVKNFFRSFSNFFKLFRRPPSRSRSSGNLHILADLPAFVKNFFQVLKLIFWICFVCRRSSATSIYYNICYHLSTGIFILFQHLCVHFQLSDIKKERDLFRGPCNFIMELYSASSIRP